MRQPPADAPPRIDRRLARESRAARTQFAVAGALGLVSAAVIVAQAALLAHIIAGAATARTSLHALSGSLIALVAVVAARALLSGAFELSGRLGAVQVMAELRIRLAQRLLVDRPGRSPSERTGELAAASVQGVDALESYFAGYLPSLVLASAVPVAVLAWLTPVDPLCTIILALTIPIVIVFMILIGRGAEARTRQRWQALSLLSSHFLDVVEGLETLRAHRRETAQAAILAEVGDRYRRETMGTLRLAFMSALVLELCAMIGTALVAATIGVQLIGGECSLDAGLTVLLLAPELYNPLRAVGQQFHASADGLAAAGRLLAVLDEQPPLSTPARPQPAGDPRTAAVRFRNVSYAYPGRPGDVLSGLELTIAPGELVAVMGASGAGKSTLAALALRLVDPTSGAVSCGSVDLRDVSAADWQARTAWVPQRAKLFAATIAENIALAQPDAARERIERAALDAGLGELLAGLPDGLDTVIGDGGRRLSAGQRQRVAIARAFLRDAPLAVLDEPTSNLDAASAQALGAAIERLSLRRSTLLITHDWRLAQRADRVIELAGLCARELGPALAPGSTASLGEALEAAA
ncbi:MAG: thiol reductant ABC exporter subunit CydD [Solirubrobacteraceae bacterium]